MNRHFSMTPSPPGNRLERVPLSGGCSSIALLRPTDQPAQRGGRQTGAEGASAPFVDALARTADGSKTRRSTAARRRPRGAPTSRGEPHRSRRLASEPSPAGERTDRSGQSWPGGGEPGRGSRDLPSAASPRPRGRPRRSETSTRRGRPGLASRRGRRRPGARPVWRCLGGCARRPGPVAQAPHRCSVTSSASGRAAGAVIVSPRA